MLHIPSDKFADPNFSIHNGWPLSQPITAKGQPLSEEHYAAAISGMVVVCTDILFYLDDGRVVLMKRLALPKPGIWEAGGRTYIFESYWQTAIRKVKQEVGLQIDPNELIYLGQP